ncbi:MAG: hypothetical protein WDN44_01555 [Sphingomonas sp.]
MEAEDTARTPFSLISCVALILLLAAILGIGSYFALRTLHDRGEAARFAEAIRPHPGARPADPKPDALDRALPPIEPEGLRFLARPTFSLDDYAVSIRADSGGAQGTLMVFARASRRVTSRDFALSAEAYRRLAASIDQALAQPETQPRYCTDGVSYVIERAAGGRRSWGTNGVACPLRYARVAAIVRQALAHDAPGPDLPAHDNWTAAD